MSSNHLTPRGRALRVAARALVGVGLVVLLLARADLGALAEALAGVRPGYLALAFVVLVVGLAVNALRWHAFLRPLDLAQPVGALVTLTFVGTFFNAFLPTGVGGDAYKSFRLRGKAGSMIPPLATVVLDRFAGLVGLGVLALAGSAVRFAAGDGGRVTIAASALALGVLIAWPVGLRVAMRWAARDAGGSRVGSRFGAFARSIAEAGREPRALRLGALVGVASALLLVAVFAILAAALGLPLPVPALPAIVLIATLMTVVPVTINGLGFREGAIVWCLAAYGVGHDEALAFALLVLAVTLASSAVGGLVYAAAGDPVQRPPLAGAGARQHVEDPGDDQQVDPDQERADRDQHGRR